MPRARGATARARGSNRAADTPRRSLSRVHRGGYNGAAMPAPSPSEPAPPRRLLFTVTSGRSGTEYLARVLALFADVEARHEPKPRFSSCFRAVVAAPHVAREFWEREKLARVERGRRPIYAETSHLFCKGFAESLVDLGRTPELLHLRRDPRATARSLWALDSVPGRTLRGVRYYLSPSDPNCLPVPADVARGWTDYQLCYWYCLEIDARARVLRETLGPRGVRVHTVELADIQSEAGVRALGERLALGALSPFGRLRLAHVANRRVNAKAHQKRALDADDAELSRLEAEVRAACEAPLGARSR